MHNISRPVIGKLLNAVSAILLFFAASGIYSIADAQAICTEKTSSITNAVCFSVDRATAEVGDDIQIQAWSETRSGSTWSRTYGTVDIKEGSTVLLSGPSTPSSSYTASYKMQSVGARVLNARDSFAGNTPTVTINVGHRQPRFTFSASASTSRVGETITLTSSVDLYKPSGTLAFYVTPPGGQQVQFGTRAIGPYSYHVIESDSRTFQFVAPFNTSGEYLFVIGYLGDSLNLPAQSIIQRVSVGPFATTTGLSVSTLTSVAGKPVNLTATVAGINPPRVISTGSVEFYDGSRLLGTATVNASGAASITTTALRSTGTRSITARYVGDANNQPSVSSAVLIEIAFDPATIISIINSLLE